MKNRPSLLVFVSMTLLGSLPASSAKSVSDKEAQQIARDAYIYSDGMLENYQTLRTQAVDKNAAGYVGGFNVYRHFSEPATPDNKDIVSPNNDTPYRRMETAAAGGRKMTPQHASIGGQATRKQFEKRRCR